MKAILIQIIIIYLIKNIKINIKKELNLRVQDYFNKVISPANKITPYITQSWLNYTVTKDVFTSSNNTLLPN